MVVLIAVAVVLFDQIVKIWVKTSFYLGEDLPITSWWHLKFIENNGMAFGLELWNKLFLTLGRIAAVALFIWFVVRVKCVEGIRRGFLVAMALIIAGAAGNIFDCVFYGVVFNDPMPPELAQAFAPGGGYAGWFEGRVVDMLYFLCSISVGRNGCPLSAVSILSFSNTSSMWPTQLYASEWHC